MTELHQLSPSDASMLYVESANTPNHIAPLIICDQTTLPGGGKLRLKQIKVQMEKALDSAPNFRRKLARTPLDLDDPYWIDDPFFDLDFHVRHMALPQPGDWRQLSIQVARLLSRPLDPGRPLWEMYVIEGLDRVADLPPGAFAVLLKIHHAMIDGMGAVALMNGMFDTAPVPARETYRSKWRPQPGPSTTEMLTRGWLSAALRPGRLAVRISSMVPKALTKRATGAKDKAAVEAGRIAPKTPFNGPITPARVYDWRRYPLAEIKALRALVPGSTVNDVALAILTGALRRYLLEKNALPEKNLVSSVPVSTRSEATKEKPSGNEITLINTAIPTTEPDPLERLRLIWEQMSRLKKMDGALSARAIADLSAELPGRLAGLVGQAMTALGDRTGRPLMANTLITNVPGMTVPMYFCGARVVNIGGGGPCMTNMGLIHLVGSYCEWFNINVVGCRDLIPDIAFYMRCVDESITEYAGLLAAMPEQSAAAPLSGADNPRVPAPRANGARAKRQASPKPV